MNRVVWTVLTAALIGCGSRQGDGKPKQVQGAQQENQSSAPVAEAKPKDSPSPAKDKSKVTEDAAKQKLKLALDSWVFGELRDKFKKDHPDIRVGVVTNPLEKPLRYEIGVSRESAPDIFEFAVIHVFESKTGSEIRRGGKVTVARIDNEWLIQGIGGD